MEIIKSFLTVIGYVTATLLAIKIISAFIQWMFGIKLVLLRLGNGLRGRKIAIFATNGFSDLKNLLVGANLFKEKNIIQISSVSDVESSEGASIFLLDWSDWGNDIDEVLKKKNDKKALIIYAKPGDVQIMDKLQKYKHTNVVNFRNRLLGDIIMSVITMNYDK